MNNTSPEVIEKWRFEFEREIYPHFKMTDPPHEKRLDGGEYFYAHMNLAWAAFCIARQSVHIELPEPYEDESTSSAYGLNKAVIEAIQSQGYKVNN